MPRFSAAASAATGAIRTRLSLSSRLPPGSRQVDWKSRGMHGFQDAMNDVKKDCPRGSCSPQKYMAMV